MKKLTLFNGHYADKSDTDSFVIQHTITIHVPNGWQHIYNNTHYRLSSAQAKKVRAAIKDGYQIPYNITLWETENPRLSQCPHCCDGEFIAGIGNG